MGTQKTRLNNDEVAVSEVEIAGRTLKSPPPSQPIVAQPIKGNIGESEPDVYQHPPGFGKEEIEQKMPAFLKEGPTTQKETEEVSIPAEDRMEEAVQLLSNRLARARNNGDHETASSIQSALNELVGVTALKKVYRAKKDHPVLDKLRRNLGIKKIQPTTIEWGGMTWHFAPVPAPIGHWAATVGLSRPTAIIDLQISSRVVGIDGSPIYEVLGVDLKYQYKIIEDTEADPIEVRSFEKYCDACQSEIEITDTQCKNCGSGLDPFDMPLALRLHCAEKFHDFLQKEFGPYEDLDELLDLVKTQMPDRVADREKLYPFLKRSPEVETTDT